jgi:hypothetical protein
MMTSLQFFKEELPMMTRFARLLAGLAMVLAIVPSASAQYYYQPAPRFHPAPQYYPQPYPGPRYYEEDYRPRRPVQRQQHYSPYRQQAVGSVCVTSRGECGVGQIVPIGTGCKCQIPGFGRKRGHVQY